LNEVESRLDRIEGLLAATRENQPPGTHGLVAQVNHHGEKPGVEQYYEAVLSAVLTTLSPEGIEVWPSSESKRRELLRKVQSGDRSALSKMVKQNLGLVTLVTNQLRSEKSSDVGVLTDVATIGLIKGIRSYDLNSRIPFARYVSDLIDNEVRMYLRAAAERADTDSREHPFTREKPAGRLESQLEQSIAAKMLPPSQSPSPKG
jgi:hypothetical protein